MNLEKMSYRDLTKLQSDVAAAIHKAEAAAKADACVKIAEIAKAHGLSLRDFERPRRTSAPRKTGAPARFRNPDNPAQTWSGRGRPPKWFKRTA